jgi:multidrug resistance efflux pump
MKEQIFRQVALARMSSPDQLDQVVTITSAREWLTLLSVVLVVACFVVWGFTGSLPTSTEAPGILVSAGKPVSVVAPGAGRIAQWVVKPGESIKPGQVVAILSSERAIQGSSSMREIDSPYSGKVIEILTPQGSRVEEGAAILTLSPKDAKALELAVFVPALKAQEVKPGMAVEIKPSFIAGGEYGFLRGRVSTVAENPSSDAALAVMLQDSPMAQTVAARRPVNEVRIQLIADHGTPSGYQWSTKEGAPLKMAIDMPCVARIVVREDPPIKLVIPAARKWIEAF